MDIWLEETIRAAGRIAVDHRKLQTLERQRKPDGSLVTSGDFAVDRFLIDAIHAQYPDDCVVTEESPNPAGRLQFDRVWIIDPIDGTSTYAKGGAEFGVLAALWYDGVIIESAAYFPELDLYLQSAWGQGCTLNGAAVQIQKSDFETARIVCKPPMLRSLHTEDEAPDNNALCVLRLCAGELDACVVVAATAGEHDYAWASCALREAGGLMTDLNGKAVPFNTVRRELPPVIVMSNGHIHDALLRQIAKMIETKPAG